MLNVANAFSLNMISGNCNLSVVEMNRDQARVLFGSGLRCVEFLSFVGHAATAEILSNELGVQIDARRASLSLAHRDQVLVCQYAGPRLPEGTTVLPDGASFRYFLVTVCI